MTSGDFENFRAGLVEILRMFEHD